MKDGNCIKNYSKQFHSETLLDTNGYPLTEEEVLRMEDT